MPKPVYSSLVRFPASANFSAVSDLEVSNFSSSSTHKKEPVKEVALQIALHSRLSDDAGVCAPAMP